MARKPKTGAPAAVATPAPMAVATVVMDMPVVASGDFRKVAAEGRVLVGVSGPKRGRFRIGRRFGAEPVTVAVTPDELAKLKADPVLTVVET